MREPSSVSLMHTTCCGSVDGPIFVPLGDSKRCAKAVVAPQSRTTTERVDIGFMALKIT